MITSIKDLYYVQADIWKHENEKYFGITPLSNWNDSEKVKKHLAVCADKFWNNGTCEFKKLLENGKCNNIECLVPGSWELVFDAVNGIICLYGQFKYEVEKSKHLENNDHDIEKVEEIKRAPVAYLPYPNDLCWFLNNSEYVLRITATVNYSLISRKGNIVKYQRAWTYDIEKDEFNITLEGFDPYENLTQMNKTFLKACYGKEIESYDDFKAALASLPEFDNNSLIYFKFEYVDGLFNLVANTNRFANPLKRVSIPINVVKMFTAQKLRSEANDNNTLFTNLVLSTNKLFALENCRTIIYKSMYNTSFSFTDCNKLFDAFKTSTNKSAGRSRLLLDEVKVSNGILYNNIDGTDYNMYELICNDINPKNNVSVLSCSRFNSSNDPKRLLMTAKLRAQAIKTLGEVDEFTHETPARILFADYKGFNYGDSIIISRSFARKLASETDKTIIFNSYNEYRSIADKYNVGDVISPYDLYNLTKSSMYNNYRNIILTSLDQNTMSIHAFIPLSVGDKITNLHGSKGIVSLILEDDQMPKLKEDIIDPETGAKFEKGPFEIIVSGLSVFRRKTSGQLFEGWARATGHDEINSIQDAVVNCKDSLEHFSKSSIIEMEGYPDMIKPCGINMIIRLNHDAVTKQSFSYIKSNYARMLKAEEMLLLNLASRNLINISNEVDMRSVNKHYGAFKEIQKMQKTGEYDNTELSNNLRFFNILKTIGFDFNLRNENVIKDFGDSDDAYTFGNLLSDIQIELFEEEEENNENVNNDTRINKDEEE